MAPVSVFRACGLRFATRVQQFVASHCAVHEYAFPVEIPGIPTIPEFLTHFRSHVATIWRPSAFFALVVCALRRAFNSLLLHIVLSMNTRFLLRFRVFQPFLNF